MYKILFCLGILLTTSIASAANLIAIRHGEAVCNTEQVFSGNTKESVKYPLTSRGKQQVLDAAKKLQQEQHDNTTIEAVYVSPFLRTKETSEILVKELGIDQQKIIFEDLLVETNQGTFEGKKVSTFPYGHYYDHSQGHKYEGETDEDVQHRIERFLEKVRGQHYKRDILIVTHGNPTTILHKLLGKDQKQSSHFENAEFRVLQLISKEN